MSAEWVEAPQRGSFREFRMGTNEPYAMYVEVRTSFGGHGGYDICVQGPGSSTIQEVRDLDKALAIGAYLYEQLLPEHIATRARRDAFIAEDNARREAERPAQQAAKKKLAKRVAAAPRIEALQCPDCSHVFHAGDEGDAVYECSRCSGTSLERRCEQCNIFMAKLADTSCPSCEAALEDVETIQAVEIDGELIEASEEN